MSDTRLIKAGWKHVFYLKGKQYYVHDEWPHISNYRQARAKQKEWEKSQLETHSCMRTTTTKGGQSGEYDYKS